jgi:hypothetical protein
MNYNRIFTLSIIVVCTLSVSGPVFAQEAAADAPQIREVDPLGDEIKIFHLQHMNPTDAASMLSELFRDLIQAPGSSLRFAEDDRTNSLVVIGQKETLAGIEALLMRLDTPQKISRSAGMQTMLFQLKHISASGAAKAAGALRLENTLMQAEGVSNSLVVSGPKEELTQVKELINALDSSRASDQFEDLTLRVVWLVDSSMMSDDAPPVPEDLRPPIAKLAEKVGIGELRTAAQMVINSGLTEAGTFSSTGSARLERPCIFEFEGNRDARTGRLQVQISTQEVETNSPLCRLQTTIKAPPGHPVILGMTPIDSKPSLFVVEIMEKADD